MKVDEIEPGDDGLESMACTAGEESLGFSQGGEIFQLNIGDIWNGGERGGDARFSFWEAIGDDLKIAAEGGLGSGESSGDHRRAAGCGVHGWNNVKDLHPSEMVFIAIRVIGTPRKREAGIISTGRIPDMAPKRYYGVGVGRRISGEGRILGLSSGLR